MRNLYALLLTAMSMEEAKAVLGIPPNESPSREEVNKAWKQKAFENHPDRGGDPKKMVEINVAKDILEGKERPTYSRPSSPSATPPGYGRTYAPPVDDRKDDVVTFDEAKGKAGIPGSVEWLFVTEGQRNKQGYSSDEFERSETAFVAYGQTDSKHVFAAAQHNYYAAYFVGGGPKADVWKIRSFEYPRREGEKLEPAWLYGNVVKALKGVGFGGKFNSKVSDIRGHKFAEDLPHKSPSTMSIKHILVALGMVAGDDPSVAGRKQVVEITVADTYEKGKPGFYPEAPNRGNFWDGVYHGNYYKVTLIINGRQFDLDEQDFTEFSKVRVGGKVLLNAIFGDYIRGKKTLTRLRQGKLILQWLAEHLRGLPADAMSALDAAAKQMK